MSFDPRSEGTECGEGRAARACGTIKIFSIVKSVERKRLPRWRVTGPDKPTCHAIVIPVLKILTVPQAPGPVLSTQSVPWLGQRAARHTDGRGLARRDAYPSTCRFQLHDI